MFFVILAGICAILLIAYAMSGKKLNKSFRWGGIFVCLGSIFELMSMPAQDWYHPPALGGFAYFFTILGIIILSLGLLAKKTPKKNHENGFIH